MICKFSQCTPEQAKKRLFWRGLHRRAWPFAAVLVLFRPRFFTLDYQLIDEAAGAANINELVMAVNGYLQDCATTRRFLHDDLRIRVSGKRLISLFKQAKARARAS